MSSRAFDALFDRVGLGGDVISSAPLQGGGDSATSPAKDACRAPSHRCDGRGRRIAYQCTRTSSSAVKSAAPRPTQARGRLRPASSPRRPCARPRASFRREGAAIIIAARPHLSAFPPRSPQRREALFRRASVSRRRKASPIAHRPALRAPARTRRSRRSAHPSRRAVVRRSGHPRLLRRAPARRQCPVAPQHATRQGSSARRVPLVATAGAAAAIAISASRSAFSASSRSVFRRAQSASTPASFIARSRRAASSRAPPAVRGPRRRRAASRLEDVGARSIECRAMGGPGGVTHGANICGLLIVDETATCAPPPLRPSRVRARRASRAAIAELRPFRLSVASDRANPRSPLRRCRQRANASASPRHGARRPERSSSFRVCLSIVRAARSASGRKSSRRISSSRAFKAAKRCADPRRLARRQSAAARRRAARLDRFARRLKLRQYARTVSIRSPKTPIGLRWQKQTCALFLAATQTANNFYDSGPLRRQARLAEIECPSRCQSGCASRANSRRERKPRAPTRRHRCAPVLPAAT